MLLHALEQACLFLPLVFAMYLSYQVLKITDLTAEGSFVLGAAIFAIGIHAGYSLAVCTFLAVCGGIISGCITAILQRFFGFSDLIAGILAIFLLHSISLKSMGRPNMSLYDTSSLVRVIPEDVMEESHARLLVIGIIALVLFVVFSQVLTSRLGLFLRAFGNNPKLLELFGKNEKLYCFIGLTLSNSLAALGGSFTAQFQGFADTSMGVGVVLIALSAVIIGQRLNTFLFKSFAQYTSIQLLSCFFGILLYFVVIHSLIAGGVDPINLRMATALVIIGILSCNRTELMKKRTA